MRDTSVPMWRREKNSPLAPILDVIPEFKVLIVDDNRPIRQLVRSILLAYGVKHIDEASDGLKAIRRLHSDTPDLVVTDLEMAQMNGLEFARQVRQSPHSPNPDLPIVVMTSYTEKHRILAVLEAGLTEVMAKPITPKLLSRNILIAMERYDPRISSRKEAPEPDEDAPEDKPDYFVIC